MEVHDGYVQVTMTLNIRLDPANPQRIWKWSAGVNDYDNGAFTYDAKPGFKDVYSADPDSADYNPDKYNRCLQALHEQGIALDVPLAPVPRSRRLADRWGLLSVAMRRKILGAIAASPTYEEWSNRE